PGSAETNGRGRAGDARAAGGGPRVPPLVVLLCPLPAPPRASIMEGAPPESPHAPVPPRELVAGRLLGNGGLTPPARPGRRPEETRHPGQTALRDAAGPRPPRHRPGLHGPRERPRPGPPGRPLARARR